MNEATGSSRSAGPGPLTPALAGERREFTGRSGSLSYYVSGEGRPILLVHSINAAASAYEVRPLYEALRRDHRVYALDLPGFGFSDRSKRSYDVELYVAAIDDMLGEIRSRGDGAVDALALSLSSEFLGRLALRHPAELRTLCLITPTGFEKGSQFRRGPTGGTREISVLYRLLTGTPLGALLYKGLVTRPSIRFFLQKTWGSKQIDEGVFQYSYETSHQPGAENAPLAFVSGRLFSKDIRTIYEQLTMPVLVMHGTRGDFADFSQIAWTRERPNWRIHALRSGALPQWEVMGEVEAIYRGFLESVSDPSQASASPSRSPSP